MTNVWPTARAAAAAPGGTGRNGGSFRIDSRRGPGVVARTLYARSSPNRINCSFIKTYTSPHTMYRMRADADGMTAAAAIGRD